MQHFCEHLYDRFCQDSSMSAADTASIIERVQKIKNCTPAPPARPPSPLPVQDIFMSSQPALPPQAIFVEELAAALEPHLLSRAQLWELGYPVEIEPNSTKAVMYVNAPPPRPTVFTCWNLNAPEFVPGSQTDSGVSLSNSTLRSDSEQVTDEVERLCVRCNNVFHMTRNGKYLTQSFCSYHWGRVVDGHYACCNKGFGSKGCAFSFYHVWSGTKPGINGPLEGYVRPHSPRGGVYAIDTEMCYTTAGLELASVAVIDVNGHVVYQTHVRPSAPILCYNTRFSGIRPRDLDRATKTLQDVQYDLLEFVGTDTILVGHALENDLKVLKLLHTAVVDTCAMYPHARGLPMRRSLRDLSKELLGRNIQQSSAGHSALEDAQAVMDLILLKVKEEQMLRECQSTSNKLYLFEPYYPLVCAA
ncbi:exonuclease GOR-like [Amyelois transitella]|uniref:exonuclease GOR-like n=1 Tax=Amyelois transitella TaxID=680683 RepID=UPI00298FEC7E|nr:exonuclease GOR-like [Amyelois transitella]